MFVTTFVKQLAYVLVVSCAAFAAHVFFPDSQSIWIIWSSFLLLQIMNGETPWQHMLWVLAAGTLTAVIVVIAGWVIHPALLASFYFVMVLAGTYWACRRADFFYPAFIMLFFGILAGGLGADVTVSLGRASSILCATLLVAIAQLVFVFRFYRDERRMCSLSVIRNMRLFNTEAFACYLEPSYPDNIYLYERRLHLRKNRVLYSLSRLRELKKIKESYSRVRHYEEIYQILLDCSQLRRRVTDHTLFLLCKDELGAISDAMNQVFVQMALQVNNDKETVNTQTLGLTIKQFETSYQNILRVTAREPLVLLFFIESLKAFKEEVDSC